MQKETKYKREGKCFGKYKEILTVKTIIFKGFIIYINLSCITNTNKIGGTKMELKYFKFTY